MHGVDNISSHTSSSLKHSTESTWGILKSIWKAPPLIIYLQKKDGTPWGFYFSQLKYLRTKSNCSNILDLFSDVRLKI